MLTIRSWHLRSWPNPFMASPLPGLLLHRLPARCADVLVAVLRDEPALFQLGGHDAEAVLLGPLAFHVAERREDPPERLAVEGVEAPQEILARDGVAEAGGDAFHELAGDPGRLAQRAEDGAGVVLRHRRPVVGQLGG